MALSRQDFAACTWLTDRWLIRYPAGRLDARGLYLHARTLVLAGDAHRDQGRLSGPQSAACAYRQALAVYGELDIPRRPPPATTRGWPAMSAWAGGTGRAPGCGSAPP